MPAPDLAPLIAWGRSLGLRGRPDAVTRRPWSVTLRLGGSWLKACGVGTGYEVALVDALHRWGIPGVVVPTAVDLGRRYLALVDAGVPLRRCDDSLTRWPVLLAEHAACQRATSGHADDLHLLGVPDLRPRVAPDQLDALLGRVRVDPALSASVDAMRGRFADDCAELAAGAVAGSLQHDDLHDGNILIDQAGVARVIDWGDASLAHPFGVLLVALRSIGHRHGCSPRDLDRLRDAYLEVWTDLATARELRDLAAAAQRVQALGRALAWERGLASADLGDRAPFGDPMAGWLEVLAGPP